MNDVLLAVLISMATVGVVGALLAAFAFNMCMEARERMNRLSRRVSKMEHSDE